MTKWISELIDTLWNVNKIGESLKWIYGLELIDTLWNTNSFIVIVIARADIN